MPHNHDSMPKQQISVFALLPIAIMLWSEIALNYYAAPQNAIFLSPYVLTIFTTFLLFFIVLLKGQICPGQRSRLLFVIRFFLLFGLGNLIYSVALTPKHAPLLLANVVCLALPLMMFIRLPKPEEKLYRTFFLCAMAICTIGILQYLLVYWVELPSWFNAIRANNFAQVLSGILIAGWYLVLSKNRLEHFLKFLVKLALIVLVINYIWAVFVLSKLLAMPTTTNLIPYLTYFIVQFIIVIMLAWLLLGKNIKNMTAWSIAMGLSLLFPFTHII